MWKPLENPSQTVLDRLLIEARAEAGPCPSCKVDPGKKHTKVCDVARCTNCGGQRISCNCTIGSRDIWDGLWPNTMICYNNKWVVTWEGEGIFKGSFMFDYNKATVAAISNTVKPTPRRQSRKIIWR